MAVDRATAKAGIEDGSEGQDPELSEALRKAGELRVSLEKEANRHREKMAAGERGWIGYPFGGRSSAPVNIAFVIMVISLALWFWCLSNANSTDSDPQFWSDNANRIMALAATALGYIFGQKTS